MSYNRREGDKKHGRRIAGSYGPPRKELKKVANKGNRHNVRIDLHRLTKVVPETEDA